MMLNKPVNDPTRKLLLKLFNVEFKGHPAVSLIMKNDTTVFTSSHAVFFSLRYKPLINFCICNLLCYMRASLSNEGNCALYAFLSSEKYGPMALSSVFHIPKITTSTVRLFFLLKKPVFCNRLKNYVQSQHF